MNIPTACFIVFSLNQFGNMYYIGAITSDYRFGSGAIHFSTFHCSGNEQNLTSCSHSVASTSCTHADDVGVFCRGTCRVLTYK